MNHDDVKRDILDKAKEYFRLAHGQDKPFAPGTSKIGYAGRVFDEREILNLIEASLECWLTYGRFSKEFEKKLSDFLGVRFCSLVNSGSSANLLAFMALTSDQLGERKVRRGDEVITVAAGFPTTIAPIVQYGAIPVFVDVNFRTLNIDVGQLELARGPKSKAVMLAHTLGNPFDIDSVKKFCRDHNLWLIEDNCDALGSKYSGRYTGTFGDIATSSFYPPHHITMGEGGAVYTNNKDLARIIESMRDWGRDCWCPSGKDNTCGKRFEHQLGELPFGYDHKYTYSEFGYNLKATDMQAAVGCAQLDKLPEFIAKRRENFSRLFEGLQSLEDYFNFSEATPGSEPSWFGFLMTVREKAGFTRSEIVRWLEDHQIQTRMLFAGNILKHPCFDAMRREKTGYRVIDDLPNTNRVMDEAFWIGVYPGLTHEMIDYMVDVIVKFCRNRTVSAAPGVRASILNEKQ
ncbi:MAG: lipopolysaccharide biosynthesis protein RfbH [Nitrospirales bacterium]|nr:lipopolysaccharide biosynthesis protein RfbH [Nitrospirales bacterium]